MIRIIMFVVLGLILFRPVSTLFSDEKVIYSLLDRHKQGEVSSKDLLRYLPLNPTTYKYENGKIITKTAGYATDYSDLDCEIYDIDNWSCYQEKFGTTYNIGFNNGRYFDYSEPKAHDGAAINVGFVRYWYEGCKWSYASGIAQGLWGCSLGWFMID